MECLPIRARTSPETRPARLYAADQTPGGTAPGITLHPEARTFMSDTKPVNGNELRKGTPEVRQGIYREIPHLPACIHPLVPAILCFIYRLLCFMDSLKNRDQGIHQKTICCQKPFGQDTLGSRQPGVHLTGPITAIARRFDRKDDFPDTILPA